MNPVDILPENGTVVIKESKNVTESYNVGVGLLGATLAQFAARNFANQALNIVTKPLAKKAWGKVFGDENAPSQGTITPREYIQIDYERINKATSLIVNNALDSKALEEAGDLLQDSLYLFNKGRRKENSAERIRYMNDGIDKCVEAIHRVDNKQSYVWIGAYFTAVSQYAFLAQQALYLQEGTEIISPTSIVDILKEAIKYVSKQDVIDDITRKVKAKFGKVTEIKDKGFYGFKYYHNGHSNTLANRSESGLNQVRDELLNTALNVAYAELIQPDVVRSWELIVENALDMENK